MKTTQAAIIGCGTIHTLHVEAIQSNPACQLRAIVETDAAKGLALAESYGCRYYADYREMLGDNEIDVVHICTPHFAHKEIIIAALAAGKHVFTEKPVALNPGELKEIKHALEGATTRLGVCYQNRLNPSSQKMKALLQTNTFGKMLSVKAVLTWSRSHVYYAQSPWRGRFATEGGSLLINQAIHTLDLMQWLAGGVKSVKGVVESSFLSGSTQAEDTAIANMELANGARGIFYATNCNTIDSPLLLEIHCENGLLQLHHNNLWLISGDKKDFLASDEAPQEGQKCYWGSSHQQAINNFYSDLQNKNNHHYVDIHQAEISLRMVEAIYQSSITRNWIEI
ncbi:Gfo/Idh/MocA family oxidoreductase [Buttiauxella selenatireducens]|uniref:Gfo/Idh/MocA family oxidoreductase n=1 Tax=Buttiauxella selenatireducens TaxID=3073902 RepID=A0ABY9SDH3_9ENTR|nr:Gfo/Idh/MocA family oxidoreductase [Buttiauxella sp. R73]WMY75023.1 Gfo/Idh/MocA family oxidoreductase [Buttiauxella sp. R73]